MKIIVIGASRGLGRQTVQAALAAGHQVTAFARHPEALQLEHPRLKLCAGDVLNEELLEQAMAGHVAVICTLGLRTRAAIGPPFAKRSYVLSTGVHNLLAAMDKQGVKRLLCVTAIGTGNSVRFCTPLTRLVLRHGLRWLFQEKDRQEQLVRGSNTAWTIIRPTALTNGSRRGALVGDKPVRCGLLTHVSRADVAAAMVRLLHQPDSHERTLVISYPPRFGDSLRWTMEYFGRH